MSGKAARQAATLTVVTPNALVPQHHPIRQIKPLVDQGWPSSRPLLTRAPLGMMIIVYANEPRNRSKRSFAE